MNRLVCFSLLALVFPAFGADKPTSPENPSLAGGYSPAKIDAEARTVAAFAVKAQAEASGKSLKLVEVVKAERQVVAGLNFRLEVEVAEGAKPLQARAVVWKKLDGSLSLTSWVWITGAR